jgi:hypothetical protein
VREGTKGVCRDGAGVQREGQHAVADAGGARVEGGEDGGRLAWTWRARSAGCAAVRGARCVWGL